MPAKTLIIVHPGSMYGSAEASLGKKMAREEREMVLYEISTHEGDIIVIDGCFSDEIPRSDNEIIETALARVEAGGALALRLWGCDAGEKPHVGWKHCGPVRDRAIFEGQEAAADWFSTLLKKPVIVSGAWARSDLESGCATSVLEVVRSQRPDLRTDFSDHVIFEEDDPFREPENEFEDSVSQPYQTP